MCFDRIWGTILCVFEERDSHFPLNQWRSRAFSRGPGRCRAWHVFSVTTCPARIMRNRLLDKRIALLLCDLKVVGYEIFFSKMTSLVVLSCDGVLNNTHLIICLLVECEGLFQPFLGLSGKYQPDATAILCV